MKKNRVKNEIEKLKHFISQENPILADVENINFWFRIEIFFKK